MTPLKGILFYFYFDIISKENITIMEPSPCENNLIKPTHLYSKNEIWLGNVKKSIIHVTMEFKSH